MTSVFWWIVLCEHLSVTLLKQPACTFFEQEKVRLWNRTVVCDKVAIYSATSTTKVLPELLNVNLKSRFDIHGSVHRRLLSRNTNKMQLCNRIYYSKVYWRLNMFRAAHRSSSGALNCICSLWFICPYSDRPLSRLSLSLGNGRSPYGHINQRLQIQFRALDNERCAARNMLSLQ